ncbi:two-component system, cell cycle sensor histidine kinase and response regulator CckA (plasmid) [Pararobbsia alpina]|uniref:hybrid sensor histidine kinase/response regulator n=1 Tax=Pararobbsia alpina TaxID=621374 RepID=UPI0039A430FC
MKSGQSLSSLSRSEALQILIDGVRDYAVYMLSPTGHVVSWNTGAQRFKGYTEPEILGHHFSRFYTEEDRAAGMPQRTLRIALEEGKFESEGWRLRKDGTRFWASVVVDPIRDEDGELVGFAKITRDITDKHEAQIALQESERQFQLLVQGVTDYAIFKLSPDGIVTNWNLGAERIKGYKAHEIVGQHFSKFYTPEDIERGLPATALATARRTGKFENEGWRVRKDGTRFWAHVVIDAIFGAQGEVLGFAKVTRDVTERKLAAEALEAANAALFQAQKMDALGKLTGGVAHDFNNLLAVISNSLDVLSLREHSHTDRKLLDGMRRATERGATLTQQLLAFARQQPLQAEQQDLRELVTTFETVLRRAVDSSIEMTVEMEHQPMVVSIDAARFEASLLNLVVNARDAMPRGGRISVRGDVVSLKDREIAELPSGRYVLLRVADTGEGMPEEVMQRAFEPFFTTKDVGKGTGLGLSQVYGFIAQSGGHVTIESKEGFGTTVSLYLPIADSGEEVQPVIKIRHRPEFALIVEDEPDLLDSATTLFQTIGFETLAAANADEALRLLESHPVDVLFTDVVLSGGTSGLALARTAAAKWPSVQTILASGFPVRVLEKEHGSLSGFTFVDKPYRLAEISRMVRTRVGRGVRE